MAAFGLLITLGGRAITVRISGLNRYLRSRIAAILAATNRDLSDLVTAKHFRQEPVRDWPLGAQRWRKRGRFDRSVERMHTKFRMILVGPPSPEHRWPEGLELIERACRAPWLAHGVG